MRFCFERCGRFLIGDIMPLIQSRYRVLESRDATGIMGCSLARESACMPCSFAGDLSIASHIRTTAQAPYVCARRINGKGRNDVAVWSPRRDRDPDALLSARGMGARSDPGAV